MGPVRKLTLMMLAGGIAACGTVDPETDWGPTKATIFRIDRLCTSKYIFGAPDKPDEQVTNTRDCQMSPAFLKAASKQAGRANYVHATATVKVTYIAPQDRTQHTGEVIFTGADDQFYALKAGDTLPILVSRTDPETIRFSQSP